MGNKSKDPTSSLTRGQGQEYVFDAAFSSLMVDFRSAKLSSPSPAVVTEEKSSGKVKRHEDDLVTPLRNFHLQTPADSKYASSKHKKKRRSSNELNLSVAAGFIHRPVVWPARLPAPSSEALSKKLLHPARLSALHSLSKCSKDAAEKIYVENTLNKKVIAMLKKNTALDLSSASVRKHPKSDLSAQRVFGASACAAELNKQSTLGCTSFLSFSANTAKKQNGDITANNNIQCQNSPSTTITSSSSDTQQQLLFSSSSRSNRLFANFQSSNPSSVDLSYLSSPAASAPAPEDSTLARSCSHEMRLEEANVNELASYLDDLLHLPRPMSTMAEMMYA